MSFAKALFLFSFLIHFCAPASFLDFEFPYKCNINDGECMKNLIIDMFQKYKSTGVPELGVPIMEPYKVEMATMNVFNMVDFILTDGLVEGATSCAVKKFESVFETDEKYIATESFCDQFKMSGHYKTVFGPLAQTLIGNSISADGTGSVQVDKMTLKLKMPYEVEKLDDGEIYLIPKVDKAQYSTSDIESITFNATNIIWGGRDVSEQVINFMNNNWKMMNRSFGKIFSDRVMQVFYYHLMEFFPKMPASKIIKDDLTPYLKIEKSKRRVPLIDFSD